MKTLDTARTILMVDDDLDDYYLVKEALLENGMLNDLRLVSDGMELMDYLFHRGKFTDSESSPLPSLILLDLNMPGKDGREALRELKTYPMLRSIPVVVFTTSSDIDDITACYEMGASSFISKPNTFDSLIDTMRTLGKYWLNVAELPAHAN
ncbi:MAG: response regulator [Deltaproteobacteria bacterium]|jgi:CheY-like chemotaxis protein